jgi:hypothetical protein
MKLTYFFLLILFFSLLFINLLHVNSYTPVNENYYLVIDISEEIDFPTLPFLPSHNLENEDNVLIMTDIFYENNSVYSSFEQGKWLRDDGIVNKDETVEKSSSLNVTWSLVYPLSSLDEWQAYTQKFSQKEFNNLFNTSDQGVITNRINGLIYEMEVDFNSGASLEIRVDTVNGMLKGYDYRNSDNTRFRIFGLTDSDLSLYIPPQDGITINDLLTIVVMIGIFVLLAVILGLWMFKRGRK